MGKNASQVRLLYPARGDQVVNDPQMKIALNENIAGQKKIEVFGHRSGERVFDGNYRDGNLAGFEQIENFNRAGTRDDGAPFTMRRAASWLNDPGSPWMAIFIQAT